MILNNPFKAETRELFIWKYDCDWCGHNGWSAIHHILGRVSDSPLNAATLHNDRCHINNNKLNMFNSQSVLLKKTLVYLKSINYVLTNKDILFIKKYQKYYV